MNKMFEHLESDVLPENRAMIEVFLGDKNFIELELMLRNINYYDYYALDGIELNAKLRAYTKEEEARIEKNLNGVAYNIDDINTLSLITGE